MSAPPGYRFNWLGQLVEDINYLPPAGFRLTRNFITNRLELAPLYGPGVDGLAGGNSQPKPNYGPSSRPTVIPDLNRIAQGTRSGHVFTGPGSPEPENPAMRKPGKSRYNSGNDEAAIF